MKKESNSRTYAIWLTLFLAVVAVVLFFVIPRTDYFLAFNNINSINENYNSTDSSNNSIENYIIYVCNLNGLTTTNTQRITADNQIRASLFMSNTFVKKSLAFVSHNAEYNRNVNLQNNAKNVLLNQIQSIQNYCKTTLAVYLKPETEKNPTTNNQIANIFINQLENLTLAFANFYNATAQIIEKSATSCMEVNALTISVNSNFNDCIQRLLVQENISTTTTQNLLNTITSMSDSNYYKYYFDNSVTVSNVVSTFNAIA
ncbi:MAG: hypothetical protein PHQ62_02490 [Clostridia bacterium]|nr:hypothetical protein [Clostridia bacterium]